MFKKVMKTGAVAQEKFLNGVKVVDDMVGSTIGPAGRNKIIQRKYNAPLITNDGVTIARHLVLDDELEDLAAQTLVDVAMKTNEQAGDGTTSSVVMASQIVRTCFELLIKEGKKSILEGGPKVNAMTLWRQIQKEKDEVIKILKESAIELKDKELDDIIATSLEDLEFGKTLGELLRTIGADGYISVEDNWKTKYGISTEITTGMKFLGTYASPYLATESNQKEAVYKDIDILVTNEKIESPAILKNIIMGLQAKGKRKLVIIGGYSSGENPYSTQFIQTIAKAVAEAAKGNPDAMQVYALKTPSLTSPEMEDVAAFCNAKFFDTKLGLSVKDATIDDLGFAKKISVDESDVKIVDGQGNSKERIKILKEQLETEKDQMFKEKLKRRIASLSAGVGIIRVGASTEAERSYLKYKLEDAVNAARAAMEEGYVVGGGQALKAISEKLGKDAVLYEALNAPYNRILFNAGADFKMPKNIKDPLKVVRLGLENACSGAGTLITADGAIAEKKLTYQDNLQKVIEQAMVATDSDFRSTENQDLGAGRLVD